jgi:hypothetical protein
LELKFRVYLVSDLMDEALKGEFWEEQIGRLLVSTDLSESDN